MIICIHVILHPTTDLPSPSSSYHTIIPPSSTILCRDSLSICAMADRITPLILTTQRLSRLGSQRSIPSIQEPQKCARHKCATNDISQRDRDNGHVDEPADTEIGSVEHADWDQEEIGDGVLIAERDTKDMSVVSPAE